MDAGADFYWPEITIGSDLNAVRFAISSKNFLLFNSVPVFNSYDLHGHLDDLESLWARDSYRAYEMGLVPMPGALQSIRMSDLLSVKTIDGGYFRIQYDRVNLFSTKNVVSDSIEFSRKLAYNKVVDWFDIKRGGQSKRQLPPSGPIKDIVFYPSSRIDGKEYFDLFSVSHLTDEQLKDYNYSDTFMKFRIQKLSEASGDKLELSFWKRQVIKVYETDLLSAPKGVSWRVPQLEEH